MGALIGRAAAALRAGGVVCYPTDTLMGLAVSPSRPDALARLFAVKRRPEGAPVSLAFSSLEEIEPYAELSLRSRRELRERLPGPYTCLLRPSPWARRRLPRGVVGPTGALGVRVPDHPVARELARLVGPITSTSANLHGLPPVRSEEEARRSFGRQVAVYLPPLPPMSGVPSTVLDLTGGAPRELSRR